MSIVLQHTWKNQKHCCCQMSYHRLSIDRFWLCLRVHALVKKYWTKTKQLSKF
jgi:hypothetical protein